MSVKIEKLEHSTVRLTIEVAADKFDAALSNAKTYQEAINHLIDEEYPIAVKEAAVDVASLPSRINVLQFEQGKNFIFEVDVTVKPEVVLGQYKNIEIEKITVSVTDEEIMDALLQVQESCAVERPVERPVMEGDIVTIDYAGTQNGVAFEGGTAEGCNLEIGSHRFIPGFEEQLIGHSIGDEFDIDVVFPEQYHAPDLAGKPAVFAIKLNGICEKVILPLNDNFAQEVAGLQTLDELKEQIKAELTFKQENEAANVKANAVVKKVIANSVVEVPQAMLETEAQLMFENMTQQLQAMGISMEDYLKLLNVTQKQFLEDLYPNITKTIQTRLVLEAIAKAENIEEPDPEVAVQKALSLISESAIEI